VLYVEELIAPGVVNTMPEATLRAFADHGDATGGFGESTGADVLSRAEDAGVDLAAITADLERDGVRSFCASYQELLDCIETKLQRAGPVGSPRS
jgi:transaldolase